ncbi:MAG TPA: urease accessory protein UreD [Candidatus Binatia bacterium]|nr:urease accessory protein UreD [Candidatus Binatia bacterium]
MTAGAALDASRVGRDGALRLRFERRGPATVVVGCRYTLPLQVLAPVALDDPAAIVSILNPTGGLVGGDRLAIDVHAAAGAHAVLTTPSATRVYRAEAEGATQVVRLSIGPQATVEWVPDHTIPFAGSAFRQTIDVDLDETAGLILVDAFSAGRIARGEAWRFAVLDSAVSIRDRHGWLLHDRFVLRGPVAKDDPAWDGLGFAESHPYFASIAIVGAFDRERFAADARRLGANGGAAWVGVAALARRGALVRCLASTAPVLVDALAGCWRLARRALLGLPPLALRKG